MNFEKWLKGLDPQFVSMLYAVYELQEHVGRLSHLNLEIAITAADPEPITDKEIAAFEAYITKHGLTHG